ncbi:hypothetical protein AC1031_006329 [Aphanomyces cochlioides]|nr:hypothetical protein AC1031_006329 [Aphanomyces cochlioides]
MLGTKLYVESSTPEEKIQDADDWTHVNWEDIWSRVSSHFTTQSRVRHSIRVICRRETLPIVELEMTWIAVALVVLFTGHAVTALVNVDCPYYDLQDSYDSILEYNRRDITFHIVDRSCEVHGTTSYLPNGGYQAIGNLHGVSNDALTFGNTPILTLEKAVFPDLTRLLLDNTSIKAFPQKWPPKLRSICMTNLVLDIAAPNLPGVSLYFIHATLVDMTSLNNTILTTLYAPWMPRGRAKPSLGALKRFHNR